MYERVSASNAVSARLIGAIFLERGLVTEEQLQAALAMQKESKEHLGEILVQHFGVSRIDLASVLAEQWAELERANAAAGGPPAVPLAAVRNPAPEPTETPEASESSEVETGEDVPEETDTGDEPRGKRRPLGEIFVEQGLVTDEELDRALQAQRESGEKLGEILVAQGSITRLQLASALADQWTALRKIRPPSAHEPAKALPVEAPREEPPSEDVDRLHEAVSALEQRLRAAESVAAREPWREEIGAATEELQKTVSALEARLDEAAERGEADDIAPVRATLDDLVGRVDALAASEHRVDADLLRRVEAAAEAAEAARSGLGGAFESLSLRLSDVEARVHDRSEIAELRGEVESLETRLSELGGPAEDPGLEALRDEVRRVRDEVTRRAEAPAADPALAGRVDTLAQRVEELAGQLKGEKSGKASGAEVKALRESVATLGAKVQELTNDAKIGLQDLRQAVAELQAKPAESDLAGRLSHYGSGAAQIDELKARVADVESQTAGLAGLREIVDELAARPPGDPQLAERVDQLVRAVDEKAAPRSQLDSLQERVEEIAGHAWAPAEDLAELRTELSALGSRLDAFARSSTEMATYEQVDDLASRVRDLEGSTTAAELGELRREVEQVTSRASAPLEEVLQLRAELAALGRRLDVLAQRPEDAVSSERFDDLSSRIGAELDRLRHALDELESRPSVGVEVVEALGRRVDELSTSATAVDRLRGDLDALVRQVAERPSDAPTMAQVEALASRLAALDERVRSSTTGEQLDEIRMQVRELTERAERPSQDVARLNGELASLAARLDELAARPADPSAELIEALDARVASLEGGLRDVSTSDDLDALRRQLTALEERASVPPEDLAALRAELTELAARFETAAERPAESVSVDDLDALRRQVAALEERASAPPEDLAALRAELTALAARVETVAERPAESVSADDLDALRRQVAALEEQASATPEDLAALRAEVASLAARLEAVGDRPGEAAVPPENVDRLGARVAALEERAGAVASADEVGGLRRELAELATRLEAPNEDLVTVRAEVSGLAARLDALADRPSEMVSADDLGALRAEVTALAARFETVAERPAESVTADDFDGLRRQLAALEERASAPPEDLVSLRAELTALAEAVQAEKETRNELEGVRRDLDELAARPEPPPVDLSGIQGELEALAGRVDEIAGRPSGDPALAGTVADLAARLEAAENVVGEARDAAGLAAEQAARDVRAELGRVEERVAGVEELASREPVDEHGPRIEALERRLADDESADAALDARIDEIGGRVAAFEQRLDDVATSAAKHQEELVRRLEEAVTGLREELGTQRADAVDRAGAAERETAALREQLAGLRDALEANVRSDLAAAVGDVRDELGALATRLDQATAGTGDVLRALRSEVAEVSSLVRPVETMEAVENELRARVQELERRLETQPEPADGAAVAELEPATESEPEAVPAPAREPASETEPEPGGYLAFVPTGQGYTLHELAGAPPSIGEPFPGTHGEDELVVARVGRSPLPLDRRQCVYLELAVAANPSDRVT